MAELYLDGRYVGDVENSHGFIERFKEDRRKGTLSSQINIHYNEKEDIIAIETCRGRVQRPLIVVKNGKSLMTEKHVEQLEKGELKWNDLVNQGVIEYLDPAEEENSYIAFYENELSPEHTHLEVTPLSIFGICTSTVPFLQHNQSARVMIGSKNQKQAVGLYSSNYFTRIDMDVNVLQTPQKPIVRTILHDIFDDDKHPSGQNIVIAVMSYQGYNMDDSIILNKSSIERGLGRSTYFRPSIAEELRYPGGLVDEVSVPDKEVKGYRTEHSYRYLDPDGIVSPESPVVEDDVVVGRTSPPRFLSGLDEYNLASSTRRESSVALKHGEKGIVDFVLLTENEEGNKLVQVRVRDSRNPELGDKFTSRHGQKGVIGLIVPQVDMPFTNSGVVPDLIFSPEGIPSRMTVSHLLEILGTKTGSLAGRYVDGTPFNSESEKDLKKELLSLGFRDDGMETLYNGITGQKFKARIFVGNIYYLRLKYMVANKIQSRASGPIQLLTRQPTEGRAKEGGLRLGEMEKDTFVAHGASLLLKERFDSDKTIVPVCEACGVIAVYDEYKRRNWCPICGESSEINNINMSYAFKLIMDELKSLCIYPKLKLEVKY